MSVQDDSFWDSLVLIFARGTHRPGEFCQDFNYYFQDRMSYDILSFGFYHETNSVTLFMDDLPARVSPFTNGPCYMLMSRLYSFAFRWLIVQQGFHVMTLGKIGENQVQLSVLQK